MKKVDLPSLSDSEFISLIKAVDAEFWRRCERCKHCGNSKPNDFDVHICDVNLPRVKATVQNEFEKAVSEMIKGGK